MKWYDIKRPFKDQRVLIEVKKVDESLDMVEGKSWREVCSKVL